MLRDSVFPEAEPGKETGGFSRALQTNFAGCVALGFEEKQTKGEISKALTPEFRKDADIPQTE